MNQVTITVTSAQIKTLNSVPLNLVAAPGLTKALIPIAVFSKLHFGTVAYTAGGDCALDWGAGGTAAFLLAATQAQIQAGVDTDHYAAPSNAQTVTPLPAAIENKPLTLFAAGADFATGDGTLTITIDYAIVPTT